MKILDYSPKDELKNLTKDITHKKTFKKQIPNLLTMSRAFGPLLIVPMTLKNNILGATIVCSLVAITDLIDGAVARKLDAVTDFGKDLDPLCDKLFVLGITIPLLFYNLLYLITLFLEGVISIINLKYRKEKITKSSYLGKIKTGALFTLLCTSYLSINNRIPEQIVPSLFTLTTFLQIAAIYGYYNTYKKISNLN